jgi:hypothetical protein
MQALLTGNHVLIEPIAVWQRDRDFHQQRQSPRASIRRASKSEWRE